LYPQDHFSAAPSNFFAFSQPHNNHHTYICLQIIDSIDCSTFPTLQTTPLTQSLQENNSTNTIHARFWYAETATILRLQPFHIRENKVLKQRLSGTPIINEVELSTVEKKEKEKENSSIRSILPLLVHCDIPWFINLRFLQ